MIITAAIFAGCANNDVKVSHESHGMASPKMKVIDIPNAKNPLPNVLTGGQPSLAHFEQAQAAGYKTIINLRMPIAGRDGLSKENARALMSAIQKHSDHPVMVHCGSGNRIGALFAIDAKFNQNQTTEDAINTGVNSGLTSLKSAVEAYISENEAG